MGLDPVQGYTVPVTGGQVTWQRDGCACYLAWWRDYRETSTTVSCWWFAPTPPVPCGAEVGVPAAAAESQDSGSPEGCARRNGGSNLLPQHPASRQELQPSPPVIPAALVGICLNLFPLWIPKPMQSVLPIEFPSSETYGSFHFPNWTLIDR